MAHKQKRKFNDWDNSRQAYRWRKRNNCMTEADKDREYEHSKTEHKKALFDRIQSGEIRTKIKMSKLIARGKK